MVRVIKLANIHLATVRQLNNRRPKNAKCVWNISWNLEIDSRHVNESCSVTETELVIYF